MTGDPTAPAPGAPAVAVIGLAGRFPGAPDVDAFWKNLVEEVDSVTRPDSGGAIGDRPAGSFVPAVGRVPGIEFFDAEYFGMSPMEAATMDPQIRVLLEVAVTAIQAAGHGDVSGRTVGVFAGTGENIYDQEHVRPAAEADGSLSDLWLGLLNDKDFVASRVAFRLGLTGPSVNVQASCATGLTAVALACQALAAGDCDLAVAGASSLLMPEVEGYPYEAGGVNSADGYCRAFGRDASGAVPASGAGVVVLELDERARRDGDTRHAVIRGWAMNNDGGSGAGFTAPSVRGQEAVIRRAMRRAGVRPREIGYVEAHGTGTPLGDPIEVEALRRAFEGDDRPAGSCRLGSVKTNIGHTDAAAGIAGLLKTVLSVRTGIMPASLHFGEINPHITLTGTPFAVNAETRHWPEADAADRTAGVSSFGLGGMNAHVVVSGCRPVPPEPAPTGRHLLILSAHREADLRRSMLELGDRLASARDEDLADIAHTLAVGRLPMRHRWAGVFGSASEAALALKGPTGDGTAVATDVLDVRVNPAELLAAVVTDAERDRRLSAALSEITELLRLDVDAAGDLPAGAAGALALVTLRSALRSAGLRSLPAIRAEWWPRVAGWLDDAGHPGERAALAGPDRADSADRAVPLEAGFRLTELLARLWADGSEVDWARYYAGQKRGRVPLPTYPFDRRRHWLDRKERPGRPPAPGAEPVDADVTAVVSALWAEILGTEEPEPGVSFVEAGGDSLVAVELGARLNERFGLDLPVDVVFEERTIRDLAAHIETMMRDGNA